MIQHTRRPKIQFLRRLRESRSLVILLLLHALELKRVPVATPLVSFLAPRICHAVVSPVLRQVLAVIVHAHDDFIALAPLALCVFALEQEAVCGSGDERDGDVHQDDAMAKPEPGLVLATVLKFQASMIAQRNTSWPGTYHVGADRAVDIAEANHHRERDAALVAALDIVRHPRYRVRDVRVDPAGGEVHTEVRERRVA